MSLLFYAQGLRGRVLDLSPHHMDALTAEALRRPRAVWRRKTMAQIGQSERDRRKRIRRLVGDCAPTIEARRLVLLGLDDETPRGRRDGETTDE